jgi:hypothetical protein
MVPEVTILGERTAELLVPGACPLCGGDVQLRVSPDGARTWCPACRVIAKSKVSFGAEGVVLTPERPALA